MLVVIFQLPLMVPYMVLVAMGILNSINANGTLNWSYPDIWPNDFGLVGNDGTVYTRSSNYETLLAINDDGTLKWNYTTGDPFTSPYLAKGVDDIVYVGSWGSGDTLFAINGDGTLKWSSPGFSNAVVKYIGNDGTLYVQVVDTAGITAINVVNDDGSLEWSHTLGYPDTVLIGTDGTIYELFASGSLICIKY